MLTLNLQDKLFAHTDLIGNLDPAYTSEAKIRWDRSCSSEAPVYVTDNSLKEVSASDSRQLIALLIETHRPKSGLTPKLYQQLRNRYKLRQFDRIFTHRRDLLACGSKFIFFPLGGCWIDRDAWAMYPKTKGISIFASEKRSLEGHQLRHAVIQSYRSELDGVFGKEYHFVENKLEGLKDYAYSVAIENQRSDYYFSEKLIDCFATGTIPIYWGCPSISDFFDPNGMLCFRNSYELEAILRNRIEDFKNSELVQEAMRYNFEKAKEYCITENNIYRVLKSVL